MSSDLSSDLSSDSVVSDEELDNVDVSDRLCEPASEGETGTMCLVDNVSPRCGRGSLAAPAGRCALLWTLPRERMRPSEARREWARDLGLV